MMFDDDRKSKNRRLISRCGPDYRFTFRGCDEIRQVLNPVDRSVGKKIAGWNPSRLESPDRPPVKEPPNEPQKPPVEEPDDPPGPPLPPSRPPVKEPPNEPDLPPVKEPPPKYFASIGASANGRRL